MKSIRSKILVWTLLLVLSAIVMCFGIAYMSLRGMMSVMEDIFLKTENMTAHESSEVLIDLSSSQAEETVKTCAQTVSAKIGNMSDILDIVSDCIKDIYDHPEDYPEQPYSHPSKSAAGKRCMQWVLPEGVEMAGDMQKEVYLLGNMDHLFSAVLEDHPNILSIYFTSATGANIGFDDTPQTKPMYYDGRGAEWYTSAADSGELYLSDTYDDSFGRGRMVTLSVPCVGEDGKLRGVCGMDILIEDMNEIITGVNIIDDSYAMLVSSSGVICCPDVSTEEADGILTSDNGSGRTLLQSIYDTGSGINELHLTDKPIYCAYHTVENTNWMIVFVIPKEKILEPSMQLRQMMSETMSAGTKEESQIISISFLMWIAGTAVVALVSVLNVFRLSRKISSPIIELSRSVERVGTGDLEYKCDIHTEDEIGKLSKSFEDMTVSLKGYIENYTKVTAEKERISAELNIAAQIQSDMLPRIFPPFPERKEFDIYATMDPAKEVGGDFYDFFLIDDDHLALVMADVSGKGVPASLFMVIAKTLIKDQAQSGAYSPAEILADVNDKLCEGNEAELFVTVWLAIIEISTGKGMAANAGHEHPVLRRKDGAFELIKYKHSPAVAMMEGMRFKEHEFRMYAGDTLFVYTDGVPEAANENNELFGNDRMLEALNTDPAAHPKELLSNVKSSVDAFVGEAPQFDDLTMLGLIWYGSDV